MKYLKKFVPVLILAAICTAGFTLSADGKVMPISSAAILDKVIDSSTDKLIVIDFYADWCPPCKKLAPLMEDLSSEQTQQTSFYKIDVQKHQDAARRFKVTGIPHVVFIKDKKIVYALTGLYPRNKYAEIIERYSPAAKLIRPDTPSGTLYNGVRLINIDDSSTPFDIYIYRGETVRLKFKERDYRFSVHIPEYEISAEAKTGQGMEVKFKAKDTGIFPIYCNGNCPSGDGAQLGTITVMLYELHTGRFSNITAKEALEMIMAKEPLILDVRTPREYYDGHIPDAVLIPLHQLEDRLSELLDHQDKDIIIYCRSGNRSVVAGEILVNNGFTRVYHISNGILGWLMYGYDIQQ